MKLPPHFRTTLAECEDAQLYDMLAHQADYLPEALEAAQDELRSRDLSPGKAAKLKSGVQARVAAEKERNERPLNGFECALLAFCPIGILAIIFLTYLQSRGYERKLREAWPWMSVGMGLWGLVALFIRATRGPAFTGFWLGLAFCVAALFGVFSLIRAREQTEGAGNTPTPLAAQPPTNASGPRCVCCGEAIQPGVHICPSCRWTQPD